MNTKAVAKLLGTSVSTVQRWVKQLNIEMERNELGHFIFSEENIELLKEIKQQLQQGVLLQDIEISKHKQTGQMKTAQDNDNIHELASKVMRIENILNQKADDVVSYQLLQHRREMEDLQEEINLLKARLAYVEDLLKRQGTEVAAGNELNETPKKKKNKFWKTILWF